MLSNTVRWNDFGFHSKFKENFEIRNGISDLEIPQTEFFRFRAPAKKQQQILGKMQPKFLSQRFGLFLRTLAKFKTQAI